MGMDVKIRRERERTCWDCGAVIGFDIVGVLYSGGRESWRQVLKDIGYYKYDENNVCYWYGKDMTLEREQVKTIIYGLPKDVEDYENITNMLGSALMMGDRIVINADW